MNLAYINPDDLSPRLREYADLIGLAATIKLVKWRGGARVFVPADPKPEHALSARIGLPAARRLASVYPCEEILVPRAACALKMVRNAEIVRRYNAGESCWDLAIEFGIGERTVWTIIGNARKLDDAQGDLF